MGRSMGVVAAVIAAALLSCCSGTPAHSPAAGPPPTEPTVESGSPRPDPSASGIVAPTWLGTRELPVRADGFGEVRPTPPALRNRRFTLADSVPPLPGDGFAAEVTRAPADVIARSTWEPGCPVDDSELAWIRLAFRGFDGERHTGELLANEAVADDLVEVFGRLYDAGYPIEEMRITRRDELDAPPTGDGNNTGVFACRATINASTYSQHAYGLALDLNPFQNPYLKGDLVLPELASAYLARGDQRAGMVQPDDVVVNAFAVIGWEWGGDWQSLKDYQHFSLNGA